MSHMPQIVGLATAALLGSLLVTGCSSSCEDAASKEYYGMQQDNVDGGGNAPGVVDMIDESDRYAKAKCSDDSK